MRILKSLIFLTFLMPLVPRLTFATGTTEGFRFRLQADPTTLDWTYAHTNYETYVLMNIMEGLVELDDKLQPQPALAKKWSVSDDGLTYTFELRPDVKWSDGSQLVAADFVTSWKKLLSPSNKNEYASFLSDVESYKAVSDHVFQVKLKHVVPYFTTLLTFWVTFPQKKDIQTTLGPYRLKRWTRGKEIEFERNPTYYGGAPKVENVRAFIESDDKKARELFRAEKLDALLEISIADIENKTATQQLKHFDYLAIVYLGFNLNSSKTSNSWLRRAVAQSLERGRFPIELKGGQAPAQSFIPRGLAGHEDMPSVDETDKAHALESLAKAQLKKKPELVILARTGSQTDAANAVKKMIEAKLELKVSVRSVEPARFKNELKRGAHDLFIGHWGGDYPDPATFMEIMTSSNANNHTGWKNAAYDELIKRAGASLNVLDRLKDYAEALHLLEGQDVALVPLYYPKTTALLGPRVKEFEINPLNYLFFKKVTIH